MEYNEESPLLMTVAEPFDINRFKNQELSLFFAIICVVDVFGVFPTIVLPAALIHCDWYGIPLAFFLFSIQIYTAILLGRCWIIAEYLDKNIILKSRYPYAALAEMAFGKYVSKLVVILLDITIFAGGIPNLLVAAQNLQLFGIKMSGNTFDLSYCHWMIILGTILCPVLWLGSPKDMKILCSLSVLTVFVVSILTWICLINDTSNQDVTDSVLIENIEWKSVISAYGLIAFQFDIHPMLLTIQVDMKDKAKISSAIFYGFLVTVCSFVPTTILAVIKYGRNTNANILQGLSPSFSLYTTAFLVTVQLCLTSAVSNSALYQHIEDYLNISRDFNYKRCLIRSSLTILAVFVAESVPKFDLVMSLIGGTLTGPLVFILPPLFYIKLIKLKEKYVSNAFLHTANHIMYHCDSNYASSSSCSENCFTTIQKHNNNFNTRSMIRFYDISFTQQTNECYILKYVVAGFIILFGIAATCTTSYVNIFDAIKYVTFSPPCLYNITNISSIKNI